MGTTLHSSIRTLHKKELVTNKIIIKHTPK